MTYFLYNNMEDVTRKKTEKKKDKRERIKEKKRKEAIDWRINSKELNIELYKRKIAGNNEIMNKKRKGKNETKWLKRWSEIKY